jgi:hypothetical protein
MTAQTPAPKASSVSALLASLSTVPPQPQPESKEDFLTMMLQAGTQKDGSTDSSPAAQPAKDPEKPASTDADGPDLMGASLLLALLAPPLAVLPLQIPNKGSTHNAQASPLIPMPGPAPTKNVSEARPAKPAGPDKSALSQIQVSPAKDPEDDPLPTSNAIESSGKLPPAPIEFPPAKGPDRTQAPASGTSVANTSQRMSFTPERNDFAGRIEQKLPPAAISAVTAADSGGPSSDGGAKNSLAFSWHDTPPETLTISGLSASAASPTAPITAATVEAPAGVTSTAPLERLEQMISHEAAIVRQSGAESLGVSLKLDSNTQLFLQLTTHNGSVEASVRCDRGYFAPEDAQWAQLQESLARQNVVLLPMAAGSNLNFQQPSGQHSRQNPAREDWASAGTAVQPAQPRKQKEQNRSRKNWESWA